MTTTAKSKTKRGPRGYMAAASFDAGSIVEIARKIAADPAEARRLAIAAKILTKSGRLAAPYR